MLRHSTLPRLFRPLPGRGAATVLTAALLGLTAAGAAWSATPTAARTSAAVRTCTVSDLYLSMGRKEGAAGSVYWPVRFTDTSTTSCALRGYPGVSVLDAAHHQLGPAATRSGSSYGTVTLAPGHSAASVIRTANGPVGGPCLRTGTYLRVYPPASRTAALIPAPWTTCSGIFQVGPVNTEGVI
ncbi:DUF4232 domain-containing protein [Streptomyces broussonetiae]|uniref:DUF4232 domain-containing protein n=1 Tax=Streptomyces broussonetiae TaxID=2686304 RepID=A0A6I6N7M5_9ACTN|nr:DUF4232 domain-containing protein [Streptomyces broussonetiae]QHA04487.1 DUF4232 domain-containing protein [Streptomyces broussonetiae]